MTLQDIVEFIVAWLFAIAASMLFVGVVAPKDMRWPLQKLSIAVSSGVAFLYGLVWYIQASGVK